jgi:hypothetical protein
MSDVQREALAVLAEVWALSPGVRLGQLMPHVGFLGEAHVGKGLGYIDDDELIAVLYRHRRELKARWEGAPKEALQPNGAATSDSGSSGYRRRPRRLSFSLRPAHRRTPTTNSSPHLKRNNGGE